MDNDRPLYFGQLVPEHWEWWMFEHALDCIKEWAWEEVWEKRYV